MARKVNASDYGSAAPRLEQDDLEQDAAILTISEFDEAVLEEDNGDKRRAPYLTFEETEDKRLWLNKGAMETLIEQLGDDADKWIGQQIPVEKHTAIYNKKEFPKVRVMLSEEWTQAFKDAGVKRKGAPAVSGGSKKR